jgi:membrane associated rhomboid family serine protease
MLIPLKIATVHQRSAYANWALIGITLFAHVALLIVELDYETCLAIYLHEWRGSGLVLHIFTHGDTLHVGANMAVLWAFGNAICSNTRNVVYPLIYLFFGLVAAATHLLVDGRMAIGSSGAVSGIVGMGLVLYPLKRVEVFWGFVILWRKASLPVWGLALIWLCFDYHGLGLGITGFCFWAHFASLTAGICVGVAAVRFGWIQRVERTDQSLPEIMPSSK